MPGMLVFTSKGIVSFSEFIKKKTKIKNLSFILIFIILILGMLPQITYTNNIIKIKLNSYQQVKDAGLWIKENSNPDDIIFSISHSQITYYSERKVISYSNIKNESEFENLIKNYKPKYLIISIFEKHPDFIYNYPLNHNETLIPIKVYTIKTQYEEQPALIIYKFI
ncbi:MAG: hypothetical protein QXY79_03695 [Candidatus Methanomethylicia archaeon]